MAYTAKIRSPERFGFGTSTKLMRCIETGEGMQLKSQVKRGSRKAPTNSRRQACAVTVCGVTAGGSGTESMVAATSKTINTKATCETVLIALLFP